MVKEHVLFLYFLKDMEVGLEKLKGMQNRNTMKVNTNLIPLTSLMSYNLDDKVNEHDFFWFFFGNY